MSRERDVQQLEPATASPAARRLTLVTVTGARKRADVALPSDEPLGLLVPELVAMVGGWPGTDPDGYRLATVSGRALDLGATLRDCGVLDGEQLLLDRIGRPDRPEPPARPDPLDRTDGAQAPIVDDVSEQVSDEVDALRGRWDETARHRTVTLLVAIGTGVAAFVAGSALGPLAPVVVAAALSVAGAVLVLTAPQRRPVGLAILLCAALAALAAVPVVTPSVALRAILGALVVAVAIVVGGAVTGYARAGLLGAGTLASQAGLWWGLAPFGVSLTQAAAVLAVVAGGLLGLLPRIAVVSSGLAGLDDQRATTGEPVTRAAVADAVGNAHRGLAVACVATAVSAAVAGWALAAAGTGWSVGLAAITSAVLLLRARAYPLTVEVLALVAAATGIGLALLRHGLTAAPQLWWVGVLAVLVIGAAALVLFVFRPVPAPDTRRRRLADRFETAAVVASLLFALGVLGAFETLLALF